MTFTHLVLSGGGFSGMVYAGVLRYMQTEPERFRSLRGIAGTSMGAFFAVAIALGVPAAVLDRDLIAHVTRDDVRLFAAAKGVRNLVSKLGVDDGARLVEPLRRWWGAGGAGGAGATAEPTFLDLAKRTGKDVRICATCVETGAPMFFSVDHTPTASVLDAVRASMAVPFLIQPVKIGDHTYIDGGLTENIPVGAFPKVSREALLVMSMRLSFGPTAAGTAEPNILTYALHLAEIMAARITQDVRAPHHIVFENPALECLPMQATRAGLDTCVQRGDIEACILQGFSVCARFFAQAQSDADDPSVTTT